MADAEALGDKRNVNVVLRLVLDRNGGLELGETLDVGGRVAGRFDDWGGMVATIRRLVAEGSEEP